MKTWLDLSILYNLKITLDGLNWAGISDIEVLREEDLFGDGDSDATFLSEENLGKSSYITDYFQYVSNSLQRPKNILKTSADFLREFQREQCNTGDDDIWKN